MGLELGLSLSKLRGMEMIPEDIIAKWLIADDDVLKISGSPSWNGLVTALEKIGHNGIAYEIRKSKLVCREMGSFSILFQSLQKIFHLPVHIHHRVLLKVSL